MSDTRLKRVRPLIAVLIGCLVLSACSTGEESDSTTTEQPQTTEITSSDASTTTAGSPQVDEPDVLTVALPSLGTESWVPRLTASDEKAVFDLIGDTLIRLNPETRELEPGLAESWSVSDDGLAWTFHLREGVPFHGDWGVATSQDVWFTWSQFLLEDTIHPRGSVYAGAVDGDMENFEIVSDTEFRIHTPRVMVDLPINLSNSVVAMTIQSQAYWDAVGEEGVAAHPVGTGPFEFVSQQRGSELRLKAVEDHWRQTPDAEEVVIKIVPDEASALAQVRSGDVDVAPLALRLKGEAEANGVRTITVPGVFNSFMVLGGMYYDHPNYDGSLPWIQEDNPEQGRAIREALTLAIDRQAIVDQLFQGEGEPSAAPMSWTPGPFAFNNPDWEVPAYDPERARELLAEGGHPDGFSIRMMVHAQNPTDPDIAEAVAVMWEAIGVEIQREVVDWAPTLRQTLVDRTHGGTAYTFSTFFYENPVTYLRIAFLPTSNVVHLSHPTVTEFMAPMEQAADPEEGMRLARELGDFIVSERLAIPVASRNAIWAVSDRVATWPFIVAHQFLNNVEYIEIDD